MRDKLLRYAYIIAGILASLGIAVFKVLNPEKARMWQSDYLCLDSSEQALNVSGPAL